jgi:hypothetical protein
MKLTWSQLPLVANDIEIAGQRFAHLRAQKREIVHHGMLRGYQMEVVDLDTGMLQPSVIVRAVRQSITEHPEQWKRSRKRRWESN